MDGWLSLTQAAFISGISYQTLRRHIEREWLYAEKPRGRWIIEARVFDDYMTRRWSEGRLKMRDPETWADRMEYIQRKGNT